MNVIMKYFGTDTIERAVAAYFARHGVNEEARDKLLFVQNELPDQFLELVCDFIETGVSRFEPTENKG
jgi:hypothetical protein